MKLFKRKHKPLPIVDINRQKMQFYWDKFITLHEVSKDYNENSEEYRLINELAWDYLDKYVEKRLQGWSDFKYEANQ